MSAEPTMIAVVAKNSSEDVRIALSDYAGHDLIDIRVYADLKAGSMVTRGPTKRGVALSVHKIDDLIAGLTQARDEAERRGLLTVNVA